MTAAPKPVPKNPPPLKPGMDHVLYDYSPFPKRPKLTWPRNARVAFCVVLHLEYFELIPAENSYKDPRLVNEFGNYVPDFRTWTQREYGNRAGIFRVLDVLDRYQIRAGAAVNAMAAERYPFLVEQFKKRKYEFIAHGVSANRMITSKMSEAEEKQEIATAIAAIEKAAGTRPKGWQGQDYGESQRTPQLLADAGREGGQVFSLSVHPWLMGMAHRIKYLDEALRRIERHGNVWHATPGEIAAHYMQTMMD